MLIATILVASAFSFSGGEKDRFPGYTKDKNGSYFRLHVKGTGTTTVDTGGAVFIKIKFVTDFDSAFLDINEQTQTPSYPMRVDAPAFDGDFLDFFTQLHTGDSASFFVNLDSLKKYYPDEFNFGDRFGPRLDTMAYLGFAVKVDSIYSREKVEELRKQLEAETEKQEAEKKVIADEEPAAIRNYILRNKIKTKPSASGLYYIETKKGKGESIRPGQTVSIKYTGKFLDGTVFDSTATGQTFDFVIDRGEVIAGFNEGIRQMKKGGKATLIIPSWLGYGEGGGVMKPYATLVFDIEIVDVKD